MVFCPRWIQLSVSSGLTALSVAIIVIAAILPSYIIEPLIESGVKKDLPINEGNSGGPQGSNWQKYINSSQTGIYHAFNLTNLKEVLLYGAVPIYQDLQINTTLWTIFYNYSFTESNTMFQYQELTIYQVMDAESQALLETEIVSPNPVFLGAMSDVIRAQSVGAGAQPQAYYPNLSDVYLQAYYLSQVFSTIQAEFANPTSELIQGFQALAIPAYFQGVITALYENKTFAGSKTEAEIAEFAVNQWATGQTSPLSTTVNPIYQGFESKYAINLELAGRLWNSSQPGSLAKDVYYWTIAYEANPNAAADYIAAALDDPNFTSTTILLIGLWIESLIVLPAYEEIVIETVIDGALEIAAVLQANYFFTPAVDIAQETLQLPYLPKNFVDLALLQFGTGIVTSLLLGTSTSPILSPTAATNTSLGAAAGLGGAVNFNQPLEIAAACYQVDPSYYTGANFPLFTIDEVSSLISAFNNATLSNLVVYLINVLPYYTSFSNNGFTATVDYLYSNNLLTAAQYQVLTLATPYLAFLNTNAVKTKCFSDYLVTYLKNALVGTLADLHEDGSTPENGGLFIRAPMSLFLFGGVTKLSSSTGLGAVGDPFELCPFGTNPWDPEFYNNALTLSAERDKGRYYIKYTGQDDYTKANFLYQYYGTPTFQYKCALDDPEGTSTCAGAANFAVNNWEVWGDLVSLNLVSDGTYFPAIQNAIVPIQQLWVSNVRRIVPVYYNQDITFKNINLRQYYILPATVNISGYPYAGDEASNIYKNQPMWFDANTPDGSADLSQVEGFPILVTFPHFYNGDPRFQKICGGLDPNPALHTTEIDIEPLSGATMYAHKRLQGVLKINPAWFSWSNFYDKFWWNTTFASGADPIAYSYIPFYWAEETGQISDSDASDFVDAVYHPRTIGHILQIVGCIVGGIGFILGVYFIYRASKPQSITKRYGDV